MSVYFDCETGNSSQTRQIEHPLNDSFLDNNKRTLVRLTFRVVFNVFNQKKLPIWSRSQNLVLAHGIGLQICSRASKIVAAQATLQPCAKAKQLCATSATPFELRYSQNQVEKVRA